MVTATRPGDQAPTTAPLVVVARDEHDAELVAAAPAGPIARAETLRELTNDEIREHGLDLQAHGSAKVFPILNL